MSQEIKKALSRLVKPGGFDAPMDRGIVLSVDKNAFTCEVQLVSNDAILQDVKLKPVANDGNSSIMGLVFFPAVNSFVTVAQIDNDNTDAIVTDCTEIESIALDTATALKLLISMDGKLSLNAVQMVFNNGKNGGIPLVNPLTTVILKLQQQVNQLITTFNTHIHPVAGASTSPPAVPGPGLTAPLIKTTDIANKAITQ